MSAITNDSTQSQQVVPLSKLWWVGGVAAVGSAIANLIFLFIARATGTSYVMLGPGSTSPEPLPEFLVVVSSVIPAIVATILLALLGRFTSKPIRIFPIVAIIVLLISLSGPFTQPSEVAVSTKTGLAIMHLISGVVTIGVLTSLGREKELLTG